MGILSLGIFLSVPTFASPTTGTGPNDEKAKIRDFFQYVFGVYDPSFSDNSLKINSDLIGGLGITSGQIRDNTISSADILNNTIQSDDIAPGSILFNRIGTNGCTSPQLLSFVDGAWKCINYDQVGLEFVHTAPFTDNKNPFIGNGKPNDILKINSSVIQRRLIFPSNGAACPAGQSVTQVAEDGTVTCSIDGDNDLTNEIQDALPGKGLIKDSGNNKLGLQACSNDQVLAWNAAGSGTWECKNRLSDIPEKLKLGLGYSDFIIDDTSGNVGMGLGKDGANNIIPADEKLVVNGKIKALTGFCIGTDCKTSWASVASLGASPTAGAVPFSSGSAFAADASNFFWDNTNKRLGLGINTPTEKLEVTGNIKATGKLFVTGNVGMGTTNPVSKLHIHGNYTNDGSGGFMLDATDSTDPEKYVLRINPFVVGTNMVGYQFQTKSSIGGTQVPLTFDNAGKVGIGTNAPSEKLEVTGNIKATGNIAATGTISEGGQLLSAKYQPMLTGFPCVYGVNSVAGGVVSCVTSQQFTAASNLATGTSFTGTVALSGNIGIGTSTPGANLAFGNTLGDKIYLNDLGGNDKYGFGVENGSNSNKDLNIFSGVNGDIKFRTGGGSTTGTTILALKDNGASTNSAEVTGDIAFSGTLKKTGTAFTCSTNQVLTGFDSNGPICSNASAVVVPVWQ